MNYSAIVRLVSLSAVWSVSWVAPAPATAATVTLGYETVVNGSVTVSQTLAGLFSIAPAMPTPAMLPGLIGMGVSIWRRKRSTVLG